MKPTAILCGTAMLITYAILITVWDTSWVLLPLGIMGVITLLIGLGDGKGTRA